MIIPIYQLYHVQGRVAPSNTLMCIHGNHIDCIVLYWQKFNIQNVDWYTDTK